MLTKLDHNYKRKELIGVLVRIYKKQYPDEYRAVIMAIREIRGTRKNKYAGDTTKDDALRWALRIPLKLQKMVDGFLSANEPRFLSEQKEIIWFSKNYPEFKIAEVL